MKQHFKVTPTGICYEIGVFSLLLFCMELKHCVKYHMILSFRYGYLRIGVMEAWIWQQWILDGYYVLYVQCKLEIVP